MRYQLNGKERISDPGITVREVIEGDQGIAVAVNLQIIPQEEWESTKIKEGDKLEVVHAIQGG